MLERHGVDPGRPSVVFVGRITRQKGVPYLLDAALEFDPEAQLVLCAGAPDTPEIGAEVARRVARLREERGNVIWLDQMLPKAEVIQLLSHATVFACPSIYEPLGIVNLEAMACEAAVVATATGGIVEVVVDGETGLLVPFEQAPGSIEPVDPAAFSHAIAERVNALIADPARAAAMGKAGRARAVEAFDWSAIAEQTAVGVPAPDKLTAMLERRTKIVATLGPSTDDPGVLDRLVAAGMDCARLNCSHGTHEDLRRRAADGARGRRARRAGRSACCSTSRARSCGSSADTETRAVEAGDSITFCGAGAGASAAASVDGRLRPVRRARHRALADRHRRRRAALRRSTASRPAT